jgi:hypothetical protein
VENLELLIPWLPDTGAKPRIASRRAVVIETNCLGDPVGSDVSG